MPLPDGSATGAYADLVAATGSSKATTRVAVEAFEPRYFNNLTLVLDAYFMHRTRALEGKDGNPLNEVRMLCSSLLTNDGVLAADKTIKYNPETSVLKLRGGRRDPARREAVSPALRSLLRGARAAIHLTATLTTPTPASQEYRATRSLRRGGCPPKRCRCGRSHPHPRRGSSAGPGPRPADRPQQDGDVEPDRPVLDVEEVEAPVGGEPGSSPPSTCQRPVMPGGTWKCSCSSRSNCWVSDGSAGRGPTRLIVPLRR